MISFPVVNAPRPTPAWRPATAAAPPLRHAPGRQLGQQIPPAPTISPEAAAVEDIPVAMSADEWTAQPWTRDEAVASFNVANLLWTIREKIAFNAVFFRDLISDPATLAVINRHAKGAEFIQAANALIRFSQQLSLPNFMSSVRNLLGALEVRILPSFGVGVRGQRPLFRDQMFLDCVRTDTTLPSRPETIDFGNLCETSLISDVKALDTATKTASEIAPEIALSGAALGNPALPALAVFAIKFAIWVVGILLVGRLVLLPTVEGLSNIFSPVLADPTILSVIEQTRVRDPKKAQEMIDRLLNSRSTWEGVTDTAMWVALGVGTLALAWIVYSITKK